jgi:chitin disaccharide deacetylase
VIDLIVNADDFGLNGEVNSGVIEAHGQGILTSASLMVRRDAAREAAGYARQAGRLSVGLHLDLEWTGGHRVPAETVPAEVVAQLELFVELVGRPPTHVDSHHHFHTEDPLRTAALGLGSRLGVPVRHFDPRVRFEGTFYGRDGHGAPAPGLIGVAALGELIRRLPPGTTELCCHPARGVPEGTSYAAEREVELDTLCDPAVRRALSASNVRLLSFRELVERGRGPGFPGPRRSCVPRRRVS